MLKPDLSAIPSQWMNSISEPVDSKIFDFVLNVCQAAGDMTMPTENPESQPILKMDGLVYAFKNIPLNRGLLAAKQQLIELGVDNLQGYLFRLLHFGQLLEASDRFGDLIKRGDLDGTSIVSDAVIFAAAQGKFVANVEETGFDIEDTVRVAHEYAAQHPEMIA